LHSENPLPTTVLIEIVGFAVDQPIRKDVASTSWHRLQNDFISHADFFDLDNGQRLLWPYLNGLATDKICPVVNISLALAAALMKVDKELVYAALQHFSAKNRIRFVSHDEAKAIVEAYDRNRLGLPPKEEKAPESEAKDDAAKSLEPARDESVTDTLQTRIVVAANTSHNGTERNGTESKPDPPKPPRKREGQNSGRSQADPQRPGRRRRSRDPPLPPQCAECGDTGRFSATRKGGALIELFACSCKRGEKSGWPPWTDETSLDWERANGVPS